MKTPTVKIEVAMLDDLLNFIGERMPHNQCRGIIDAVKQHVAQMNPPKAPRAPKPKPEAEKVQAPKEKAKAQPELPAVEPQAPRAREETTQ